MLVIFFSIKIKGWVSKCNMLKIHVLKMVKICFIITSWTLAYVQVTTDFSQTPKRQIKETSNIQILSGGSAATTNASQCCNQHNWRWRLTVNRTLFTLIPLGLQKKKISRKGHSEKCKKIKRQVIWSQWENYPYLYILLIWFILWNPNAELMLTLPEAVTQFKFYFQ